MNEVAQESTYPLTFRDQDTKTLADHIALRHSVELVGMKRVGISNFLRFFLENKEVYRNYIPPEHIFITVDLNDLVERELYAFWILTFKRINDTIQNTNIKNSIKEQITDLFTSSIQSQDLFLAIENIRSAITTITNTGLVPTLFLLRFDRMQNASTPQFLSNLQGLIDASGYKLSYVFTSARPLDQIAPTSFPRASLSTFSHIMYLKPAKKEDILTILSSLKKRYNIMLSKEIEKELLTLTGGHVQYLHLSMIILNENKRKDLNISQITELISKDERIILQSEEIWDSLTSDEKNSLIKALNNNPPPQKSKYLHYTGILSKNNNPFNPLFEEFVKKMTGQEGVIELTKKEHLLFTLLNENLEEVCDRDTIIHAVWPEYEEEGVTDWTIDRLISRLRAKLKLQNSDLRIITIKTRGYKLSKS